VLVVAWTLVGHGSAGGDGSVLSRHEYDRDLTLGLVGVLLVQREDADYLGPEGLSFGWGARRAW